mmetsp:Transcript_40519/g.94772  ORF Transcript_40519/g.94772 Transcript_40519/m.94772 type:complete len:104 (-) Transcript_40519:576-887(-)
MALTRIALWTTQEVQEGSLRLGEDRSIALLKQGLAVVVPKEGDENDASLADIVKVVGVDTRLDELETVVGNVVPQVKGNEVVDGEGVQAGWVDEERYGFMRQS